MGIAEKIIENQDREGMLRRSLERIIQLYTDKSHFVYELLQNADDAEATEVTNTNNGNITVITPAMVAGDDNQ